MKKTEGMYVHRGEEKGYFEFGGSTILLLLQKKTVRFNKKLYERRTDGGEISVRRGEFVAAASGLSGPL